MKFKKEGRSNPKIRPASIIILVLVVAQAFSWYMIFDMKSKQQGIIDETITGWKLKCSQIEVAEKSYNFNSCDAPSCTDISAGIQKCVCSDDPKKIYLTRCIEATKVIPVVYTNGTE
ncbi:MAG: hypothetical protein PHE43_02350 [Candidatus Nanoarchaeia archaeon]|nr:hypothetical protein [Candidatus Nanoarchaeia archaeon]